jgi:hypothetical protein
MICYRSPLATFAKRKTVAKMTEYQSRPIPTERVETDLECKQPHITLLFTDGLVGGALENKARKIRSMAAPGSNVALRPSQETAFQHSPHNSHNIAPSS